MAPQLHLPIEAAEELDRAVGAEARAVAGAVEARARLGVERVRDEALGGQIGAAQVAVAPAPAPPM